MTVINKKTMKKAKEVNEAEEDEFYTVAYDLPSESRSFPDKSQSKEEETKKELKNKRHKALRIAKRKGFMISQSVYVLHRSNMMSFLNRVEDIYEDSDFSKGVRVDIIGRVYNDVLEDMMNDYLNEKTHEVRKKLEGIQSQLVELSGKDEIANKLVRKLYALKRKITYIENRTEDMDKLNPRRKKTYNKRLEKLIEKREDLIKRAKDYQV